MPSRAASRTTYEGRGIPQRCSGLAHTRPAARDYAFARVLVVMSEGEGLAQSSQDNPEWLAPGAEAFKAIAPEPIASELHDYYEYYHRYMSQIEPYTLVWPKFDSLPGYDRLKPWAGEADVGDQLGSVPRAAHDAAQGVLFSHGLTVPLPLGQYLLAPADEKLIDAFLANGGR